MRRLVSIRLLLTLAALAATNACEPSEATDASTVDDDAELDARWRVGDAHRYAVEWQVDTDLEVAGVVEGPHSQVRLHLAGELVLRVVKGPGDGVLLGLRWERLDDATLEVLGGAGWEDREAAARRLVGLEVLCELAADGSIAAAYFDPDAPPLFRHLMSGILVHTDLRVPEPGVDRWEVTTPGSNGLVHARYRRSADDPAELRRELVDFAEIRAVPAAVLAEARPEAEGETRARFDEDGVPTSIEAHESLRLFDLEDARPRFASAARFSMRRLGSGADDRSAETPALGSLRRQLPGEPVDDPEAARQLAARFAGTLTTTQMIAELRLAGPDMPAREGLIVETTGLLRAAPAEAFALSSPFLDPEATIDLRERVFDILAAAGTVEAQAVMRELLDSSAARVDGELLHRLVGRLAFVDDPAPETVAALVALHHQHAADPTSPVYLTTLYTLGSVGRRTSARDPVLTAPIHAILVARLNAARTLDERLGALAGLGNLGSAGDLDRLLAWRGDPNPEIRAQVGHALRRLDLQPARAALEELLGDDESDVAIRALLTLTELGVAADEAEHLITRIEAGTISPRTYGVLCNVFSGWLAREPTLTDAGRRGLLAIAESTEDPLLRATAQRLAAS